MATEERERELIKLVKRLVGNERKFLSILERLHSGSVVTGDYYKAIIEVMAVADGCRLGAADDVTYHHFVKEG